MKRAWGSTIVVKSVYVRNGTRFSVPYFLNGVSATALPFKLFTKRLIDHGEDIARRALMAKSKVAISLTLRCRKFTKRK